MARTPYPRHVYAVIMAGGGGERFWPKSRQSYPKQLLAIFGARSMIQETAKRVAPLVPPDRLLVVTNRVQAPHIRRQLPLVPKGSIVAEPFGRDTAACIALAAAMIMKRDPEALMVVLPADHVIGNTRKLLTNLRDACRIAWERRCLVTLGVPPTGPSTGYGYIRLGPKIPSPCRTYFSLARGFTEKPNLGLAR
ncbi:MAG: sugar phosphate nucleotidyltransferase, partial [Candidatus Aureabacteria bacterium]|nr:sugar phosphate nucleotidyltransferase [Candidatus Auribacterota bacterium]